jgi:hypothetical protein
LGEHLLCKQGVIGSIPISSTKTHSLFPNRRHEQVMTPIWKQAVMAGFNSPRAGLSWQHKKVWMFDNEIDWVMRIKMCILVTAGREAG